MDLEFIALIIGLIVTVTIIGFFIHRTVTFIFLRKVVVSILEPVGANKYHVLKKIKKRIGTDSITFDEGVYPIDLRFSITDVNNSELLFFKKDTGVPLTFFSTEKNNSKILKTMLKTKIWGQIFGGDISNSTLLILTIVGVISLLMIGYLIYTNNQLSTQLQILTKLYNATRSGGGIVIGK